MEKYSLINRLAYWCIKDSANYEQYRDHLRKNGALSAEELSIRALHAIIWHLSNGQQKKSVIRELKLYGTRYQVA